MGRVNKVVIGPLAVTAEGYAICSAGHTMMCTAAKQMGVTVIALAASFMITPITHAEQNWLVNQLHSPASYISYDHPVACDMNTELRIPMHDLVPSQNIGMLI
jgi:translation initiation factor 2B subunit (eIF-2B alpha/beta/delta family)